VGKVSEKETGNFTNEKRKGKEGIPLPPGRKTHTQYKEDGHRNAPGTQLIKKRKKEGGKGIFTLKQEMRLRNLREKRDVKNLGPLVKKKERGKGKKNAQGDRTLGLPQRRKT